MARRAASALTAIFAFAAVAAPTTLLTAASPPAAAATSGVPATVTFTALSPQWARPGTTLTVKGSVKNTAPQARRLAIQLFDYSVPVTSVSELQQSAATDSANGRTPRPLPNATWQSPLLRPGAAASWSFRVPVSVMGLTRFGVYMLNAQVSDLSGQALNQSLTYVPYVPAKSSPDGSSVPAAQKISWVWPLIDQPLLDEPWQDACTGPQAAALAESLTSGGRLGQLVTAAGSTAGSGVAQAQAARAGSGPATQQLATLTEPGQTLAQDDAVTWAVDPALLVNVNALAQCGASKPQWARAATSWLARLKAETASQPMFITPYGDPNVAALNSAGHAGDVENAYTYGRNRASQILARNLVPAAPGTSPADAAAVAWPAGSLTSYVAAELVGKDGVATLLTGSSQFSLTQTSVVRAPNFLGGYVNVLLANDSLTGLLGSAAAGPGSAFVTAQQFLAETALLAAQHPSAPIIVAPPQRWRPPAGLAAALLTDTASAPWLTPSALTSLTGGTHVPSVSLPLTAGGQGLGPLERDKIGSLDAAVSRQLALRAEPSPNLYLAVSTAESSAYSGRFKSAADMVAGLTEQMAAQEQRVHIIAENRITLGGTRGSVPVSIVNRLPFPVRVRLQLSYVQTDGMRVSASQSGPSTVPAHTARTIKLRITAAQPGSTTITMTLLNAANQPLASPQVRTTVQTTQVGLLGMIIFGVALGVFLLASAARAIRRGRPQPPPAGTPRQAPREDDQPGQSTEGAGPDTVVSGPTGAAPPWTPGNAGLHESR